MMLAIMIKDPWASKIAKGMKTIETRTWKTRHRGTLLLCCSKKPDSPLAGQAFAVCRLADCRTMERKDIPKACISVYPGAQAWVLKDIRLVKPFPINGKLGLFRVETKEEDLEIIGEPGGDSHGSVRN